MTEQRSKSSVTLRREAEQSDVRDHVVMLDGSRRLFAIFSQVVFVVVDL